MDGSGTQVTAHQSRFAPKFPLLRSGFGNDSGRKRGLIKFIFRYGLPDSPDQSIKEVPCKGGLS